MVRLIATILICLISQMSYGQIVIQTITEAQRDIMSAGDTVGIYALNNDKLEIMTPINFSNTKINTFGTALSFGLASTKLKYEYTDKTSPYQFEGEARFRIYFGIVPASKAARFYMFSSSYSIRDLQVAKFNVKKNKRILDGGSVNIWSGVNMGVKKDNDLRIEYKTIRDGVYDVVIKATPGEYCFVFNINGTGAYNSVFDFTIR